MGSLGHLKMLFLSCIGHGGMIDWLGGGSAQKMHSGGMSGWFVMRTTAEHESYNG